MGAGAAPGVVRQHGHRDADAVAAVVPTDVERVGQQLEDGVAATRDLGGLLPQQFTDLRIGHPSPKRQVEERPVTGVEIADGGWQAISWHS